MLDPKNESHRELMRIIAYKSFVEFASNADSLYAAIKEYGIFTDEGAERFLKISDKYFADLAIVINTENDIRNLRNSQ